MFILNIFSPVMKTFRNITAILTLASLVFFSQEARAQDQESASYSLGTIDFPTSAEGSAQKEFLTGMLALHSFWYPEARTHFRKAKEINPDFAMAYWGEALTHDHPIWGQHDQSAGYKVLNEMDGRTTLAMNEREEDYIEAVRLLFEPEADMDRRRIQYAQKMNAIYEKYPGDDEALVLSALAEMSLPGFNYGNPDVRDVVPVAAKLEDLYRRNPEHPGAMHYLIHVYDSEKFAELGLRPADDYADVAYSSSHAIHMPSHIYKQLGMWQKVIESNIKAWETSVKWQQKTDRPLLSRDYHSYSWLFEAYLEIENFNEACSMINELNTIKQMASRRGEGHGRISRELNIFRNQYENHTNRDPNKCLD